MKSNPDQDITQYEVHPHFTISADPSNIQVEIINPLMLLTAKPVVYLVNLSEKDYIRQKNKHLPKLMEWIKANAAGDPVIPISVSFEERLTHIETDGSTAMKRPSSQRAR